jgi:hypothetical protein
MVLGGVQERFKRMLARIGPCGIRRHSAKDFALFAVLADFPVKMFFHDTDAGANDERLKG